jgi:hypothetical protein
MTSVDTPSPKTHFPCSRTTPLELGLLIVLLLLSQVGAVAWCYLEFFTHTYNPYVESYDLSNYPLLWQRIALASATSVLAVLTLIGAWGLLVYAAWGVSFLRLAAFLQILSTLLSQIAEAILRLCDKQRSEGVMHILLLAVVGIVLWNVIPVCIFILTSAGRPRPAPTQIP